MSERRRLFRRQDWVLAACSLLLGVLAAAAFAAYRAVSAADEDTAGRLAELGTNVLWPGVLIFAGVAVTVFAGWKANLD